jgi:YebC/PmpR family DNA-binding regulatory protein
MSGHSKWATTKRQKAVVDAKKSNIFTKLSNSLAIAAREGGDDANTNFKLKIAIEKAKAANMPKNNIDRAISRGSGKNNEAQLEQLTYEGVGPEKLAVIIEAITDNRNRTVANLKHVLTKHGGQMAANGSLLWMFDRKGVVVCSLKKILDDNLQLQLIDAGADDWEKNETIEENKLIIYCEPANISKIIAVMEKNKENILSNELEYLPKETTKIQNLIKWKNFIDELEQVDDVQNYYTNGEE